ncbi:MAG: hypothetical protein JNL88_00020 [Bacteroidia bacterium]|nr:hypothetical protein [Bacteroidia bacterium]
MAINKNHEFEELEGVKCCIVERSVSSERAAFLKALLEGNGYTVIVSGVVPKAAPAPAVAEGEPAPPPPPPPAPTQFTVGVTDMTFNSVNAVFGRLLRTPEGQVVTLAYWQQKESRASDEVPYFEQAAE